MKLTLCPHINMVWDDRYSFHCPDCDEKYEVMANGMERQLCHVCGGRHWRDNFP